MNIVYAAEKPSIAGVLKRSSRATYLTAVRSTLRRTRMKPVVFSCAGVAAHFSSLQVAKLLRIAASISACLKCRPCPLAGSVE